jgi:hypothetical protein
MRSVWERARMRAYKNVADFEVAMDNAIVVEILHGLGYLHRVSEHVEVRKAVVAEDIHKPALAALHHHALRKIETCSR